MSFLWCVFCLYLASVIVAFLIIRTWCGQYIKFGLAATAILWPVTLGILIPAVACHSIQHSKEQAKRMKVMVEPEDSELKTFYELEKRINKSISDKIQKEIHKMVNREKASLVKPEVNAKIETEVNLEELFETYPDKK